jgi:hypothetical protein
MTVVTCDFCEKQPARPYRGVDVCAACLPVLQRALVTERGGPALDEGEESEIEAENLSR